MARVLSIEEILESTNGIGYSETKWPKEGQTWIEAESFVLPCVWGHGTYYDDSGSCEISSFVKEYNLFHSPTAEEVINEDNDDGSVETGIRIWDSRPTEKELLTTPWEVS